MYKIINKNTGNEFICNKVTIEGYDSDKETIVLFDYYHTLENVVYKDDCIFIFKSDNQMITCLAGSYYGRVKTIGKYYKLIATTDPNVGCYLITDDGNVLSNICDDEIILTMVHELDNARDEWLKYREKRLSTMGNSQYWDMDVSEISFIDGYQRAKELHQFTKNEMVEFGLFCVEYNKVMIKEGWNVLEGVSENLLEMWYDNKKLTGAS